MYTIVSTPSITRVSSGNSVTDGKLLVYYIVCYILYNYNIQ